MIALLILSAAVASPFAADLTLAALLLNSMRGRK